MCNDVIPVILYTSGDRYTHCLKVVLAMQISNKPETITKTHYTMVCIHVRMYILDFDFK